MMETHHFGDPAVIHCYFQYITLNWLLRCSQIIAEKLCVGGGGWYIHTIIHFHTVLVAQCEWEGRKNKKPVDIMIGPAQFAWMRVWLSAPISLTTPLPLPPSLSPPLHPPLSPSVHRGLSTLRRRQKAVRIPVSAAAPRRRGGRDHLVGPSAERISSLHALGAETICFFPLSLTFPPAGLISSPQVRDLCSSFVPFLRGGSPHLRSARRSFSSHCLC